MIKFLSLASILVGLSISNVAAQSNSTFLKDIHGLWKQIPVSEQEEAILDADNYFEFLDKGNFKVSVDTGSKKPKLSVVGQGSIQILSENNEGGVIAIINLNEELTTNTMSIKDSHLVIYATDEETKTSVIKLMLGRPAPPTKRGR
ncbi:MAG: hypothetical protein ACRC9L_08810 [Brevinema sp.]